MNSLKETLKKLLNLQEEGSLITNLYLKLGAYERADRKYLTTFKDLVIAQREHLKKRGLEEKVIRAVEEDFVRIESFLSEPENLKGCRGLAVFSSSNRGVFEVVKLPYVYRNRLSVAPTPLLREIAAIDEELGRVGLLLIDRKHVKFFHFDLDGLIEVVDFMEPLATRAHRFHSGGSSLKGAEGTMKFAFPARVGGPNLVQHSFGEYRFHSRIREEKHRLYKLAADALMEAWKESKFDRLLIGSDMEDIREIENHLHNYLRQRLIGYIRANPSFVDEHQLKEEVMTSLIQWSLEEEKALMEEFSEMLGRGLALNGTSKVLEQLHSGNVRVLFVPEDFRKPGFVCEKSGLPMLTPQCPSEEGAYEVPDVIDQIVELALEERARVKVLTSQEAIRKVDGLACIMRFAL